MGAARSLTLLLLLGALPSTWAFLQPASAGLGMTRSPVPSAARRSAPRMVVLHDGAAQVGVEELILPMMDDTRLKIKFSPASFMTLWTSTNGLLASFKVLKTNRDAREASMEYKTVEHGLSLEFECNPNIHPDAFHALVFVKVRNDFVEVSSQCQLSAIVDALKQYKAQYSIELPK